MCSNIRCLADSDMSSQSVSQSVSSVGPQELFVMTSCLALMTYWLTAHGTIFRRYYVKGRNSPAPVLAFMAAHSACAVGAPSPSAPAPGLSLCAAAGLSFLWPVDVRPAVCALNKSCLECYYIYHVPLFARLSVVRVVLCEPVDETASHGRCDGMHGANGGGASL